MTLENDLEKIKAKLDWSGFDRTKSKKIIEDLIEEIEHLRERLDRLELAMMERIK